LTHDLFLLDIILLLFLDEQVILRGLDLQNDLLLALWDGEAVF
jgi:hypothetical protein